MLSCCIAACGQSKPVNRLSSTILQRSSLLRTSSAPKSLLKSTKYTIVKVWNLWNVFIILLKKIQPYKTYADAKVKCLKANDHAACPAKEPFERIRVRHPCLRCSRTDNRLLIRCFQVKENCPTKINNKENVQKNLNIKMYLHQATVWTC